MKESDLLTEKITVICTMSDGTEKNISFLADDVCVLDTVTWRGYIPSAMIIKRLLPANVVSFRLA